MLNNLCVLALISLLTTSLVQAEAIRVIDAANREVTLKQPAQRIVALAPHIVENVFSAGAGDKLVGVVSYSDYPAAAKQIPIVGGYHAFSLEKIASLQPDLVITWAEGNGAEAARPFENLNIPVYVDEPRQLHEVAESIREIGELSGTSDTADAAAKEFMTTLAALQQRYDQASTVPMFYQVWNKPLMTVNHEHLINAVIELCHGKNIFADAPVITPKISIEAVLGRNPSVIIASGMGEERPEWLDDWRSFPQLSAVSENNLYFIPPSLLQRHTARILLGAEKMCHSLQQARNKLTHNDTKP